MVDLLHFYAHNGNTANAEMMRKIFEDFTPVDEQAFDAYIRAEGMDLLNDKDLSPFLIDYVNTKVEFKKVTDAVEDYKILSTDSINQ